MKRPSFWFWASLVALAIALATAALMMVAAWDHNPEGSFHNENGVEWFNWLSIGVIWFVIVAVPGLGIVWLVRLAAVGVRCGPRPREGQPLADD